MTSNRNIVLEEIEASRAAFEIYEGNTTIRLRSRIRLGMRNVLLTSKICKKKLGAIFIHQGKPYLVEELNSEKRYAKVHLTRVDWTTQQRDYTNVNVLSMSMSKPISSPENRRNTVGYGKVQSKNLYRFLLCEHSPVMYMNRVIILLSLSR